ncbi:hypothetical protein WA026_009731 [Henosepilachna vigintioctopunctata]|uniref:Tetratricopeptide repeat protein 25 n=1 Tax=Henosepilachna vigintioctopunctata TaxID=420089 RepID=A0AAW1TSN2_9CUCU
MVSKPFKIEKLNDTYNWPVYYRELGYYVKQREEYERSLKFFDKSLLKAPDNTRALHGRAVARAKSIKFGGALEDITKILTSDPDNIYLRAEKALIAYLGCEFEEALIQNYRNVPLRKKPDNFVMGVMHCEDAILNCISERAGKPLRDHFKLIRKIAWLRTLSKQRPYKPQARFRKKKKKPLSSTLPYSQKKKRKNEKIKLIPVVPQKMSYSGSEGKGYSMEYINDTSSITDTLGTHESSLANFRIPKGKPFPYKPIQRYTSNMENYLAERYLDKLYHDKLFLKNLPNAVGANTPNAKGSNKIKQLSTQGFRNVYHAQEILRARRPFYFIKYQEAAYCRKLSDRMKETTVNLQKMASLQVAQMMTKLETSVHENHLRKVIEAAEKLAVYCDTTPKTVFPNRQEHLSKMVDLVCEGFYESKKFPSRMTEEQKLDRCKLLLGLPMKRIPSSDSLANEMKDWFIDWKKMISIYDKRLYKANTASHLSWLYHELSRFSLELKKYEMARMYARKCIAEAGHSKISKWIINSLFVTAKIDIMQTNKNDAKNHMKQARKIATRIEDNSMIDLIDKCLVTIDQSAEDEDLGNKILEMREKQIVQLLSSQREKDEASFLFKRIASLPANKRMSIIPGFIRTDVKPKVSNSSSGSDEEIKRNASSKIIRKSFSSRKKSIRGVGFLDLL